MLKFERHLLDGKAKFSDMVAGRKVYATTRNGASGAAKIFEIMKATNGFGKAPAIRQN